MKKGLIAFAAVAIAASAIDVGFGPANCVSLSRSEAGTCVVHTKCAGQDISNVDISFNCLLQSGSRQLHSLGAGSFDEEEDYDTDLKCEECLPPLKKEVQGLSLAALKISRSKLRGTPEDDFAKDVPVEKELKKAMEVEGDEKEKAPKAEWYGPDECVGTWRDEKTGTCVMQTDCDKDVQLSVYEFGLVCVDQDDQMTRHIFGMGSFGHKETFNTLIKCEECLALDEYMDGDKGIDKLTKMVGDMRDSLKDVSKSVVKLNKEVFPKAAPGPAPEAAAKAPAAAKAEKKEEKPAKAMMLKAEKKDEKAKPVAAAKPAAAKKEDKAKVKFLPPTTPAKAAVQVASSKAPKKEAPEEEQGPTLTQAEEKLEEVALPVQGPQPEAEVQHVKKRASEQAAPAVDVENESMQDLLAAAVKGAAADGAVIAPALQKDLSKVIPSEQVPVVLEHKQKRSSQKQVVQKQEAPVSKHEPEEVEDEDDDEDE